MKIIYKKGDLLECEEKIIVHGCNAKGVMGAGVAKEIKRKYPFAFNLYRWHYENEGLKLGQVIIAKCKGDKLIMNAIIQTNYGRENKKYVSYNAIERCMSFINNEIKNNKKTYEKVWGSAIAMPKIGAGLAGGNWSIIEEIIEKELTEVQSVVYYL